MDLITAEKSQQASSPAEESLRTGSNPTEYAIEGASGVIATINNIVNMTVVSKDLNDLKAEYHAGFVQGKLQGTTIISARDNAWSNSYLLDPEHKFPKNPSPAGRLTEFRAG